jgi:hypothetical protein
MFNPALLGAALVFAMVGGFWSGHDWAQTKAESQRMQDLVDYNAALHRELARGNELSDKLAKAESRITIKNVEVIKYVPTVTTGLVPCLGPAAISLLQPGSDQGLRPPAGEPATEGAGALAASDRDVAYFIASANQQYDTCAVRLNTLVDFEQLTNPEPLLSDGL